MKKTINEDDLKRQELGKLGELAVVSCLKKRGHTVEYSESGFDSKKDLIMNGKIFVEVKTQTVFFKTNSFSINETQYHKCTNAGALIFVQTPHPDYPDENDGAIYAYDQKSVMENLGEPEWVWDHETKKKRLSYPVKRQYDKIIGNVRDLAEDVFDRMKSISTSKKRKTKIVTNKSHETVEF